MSDSFAGDYLAQILSDYREQKRMADEALARVDDGRFFARQSEEGDEHTNSIAIIVKHLSGNLRSRWTDFLTTDGEKADRHREREFLDEGDSRAAIMQRWEQGWQVALRTLESLHPDDFARTITIRGEPHSVLKAIQRNLLHATHHIGQIDLLSSR